MGTNYYWHRDSCAHCGRSDEPVHIGKSSGGWCFGLHVAEPGSVVTVGSVELPHDLNGWRILFDMPGSKIVNEYGEEITAERMLVEITERGRPPDAQGFDAEWLGRNNATVGPNNLARHTGFHRYGEWGRPGPENETWDYCYGEFS